MTDPNMSELPQQSSNNSNGNNDEDNPMAVASSSKVMDSPKTPVRSTFDDSFDECDSDELESPQVPHLLPVYNRRNTSDYDLEGVRIGWDDGCGCVCYNDDDDDYYINGKNKRLKRSRFSNRRHRSMFESQKYADTSPSPRRSAINNLVIQEELNNYLECILNFLSDKKKSRDLMKLKCAPSSSTSNNSTENNTFNHLLNDSTDDEMMLLCSQAIEKEMAADANSDTVNVTTKSEKKDSLSIVGISPLKDTNNILNNNVYHNATKKFKPLQTNYFDDKCNSSLQYQSHTFTTNTENNLFHNINNNSLLTTNNTIKCNKEDFSTTFLNDTSASDDDLFSAIDLSEIDKQFSGNSKETASTSATQKCDKVCNKQLQNQNIFSTTQFQKKAAESSTSTVTRSSSSVFWRKSSSSSSIVNKQLQNQQQNVKSFNGVNRTINFGTNTGSTSTSTTTRYCTPAEIEAKRERARRTLMLKFKSKYKSSS